MSSAREGDAGERTPSSDAPYEDLSKETLETIIAQSGEGIIVADARGVIRVFNAEAQRQHGVSRRAVTASDWSSAYGLIAEDVDEPLPPDRTPLHRALRGETVRGARWRVRRPDGELRLLEGTATPLLAADGSLTGAVIVTRDVTDVRRDAAERESLRERLTRAEAERVVSERIRLSEEMLKQVPDAVIITDMQGTITRWDGGATQMFGYDEGEALGRPVNFVHRADVREAMTARIIQSILQTGRFRGEVPCVRADGREILVEVSASTFTDANGTPIALIGVNRDVTERRQVESEHARLLGELAARRAVEDSERRFRALAEGTSVLVWTTDPTGVYPHDSPSWRAFTGQTVERWTAGRGWDAIHPDDTGRIAEYWGSAVTRRLPCTFEYRLRRHDGVYVPMSVRATPVFDGNGELAEWVGANQDISARSEQEEERARLLASERAARADAERARKRLAFLDSITRGVVVDIRSPEATMQRLAELLVPSLADWCTIYLPGPGGRIDVAAVAHADPARTEAARDFFERYPVRSELDWGVAAVMRTGKTELLAELDDELLAAAASSPEHLAVMRASGIVSHLAVPLVGHAGVVGVLALSQTESGRRLGDDDRSLAEEIGARAALLLEKAQLFAEGARARAEAEAANRAKDEFLAMLGHELRNPLAPIKTALEVMRRRDEGSRPEREVIERQVGHMVELVDDLLDVSRITRGKIELRRQILELSAVIASALEMTAPLFERHRHRVTVDVAEAGLPVDGDPGRLAQIFSNLLNNASKYTPPGGSISIRAGLEQERIVVEIADDGAGIDAGLLPQIFELFTQGPQSIDRSKGGLGLGLAIVSSLAELHGGSVEARSDGVGRGSTFVVRLPRAEGRVSEASPVAKKTAPTRGLRVLVVDDNEDAAWLLDQLLSAAGHVTAVASDGIAALEIYEEVRPDVALLDIGLPVIDGYELARRIRKRPSGARVRLVALTGYGQESDRAAAREAGFDAHLVKPADFQAIEALLARFAREAPADR